MSSNDQGGTRSNSQNNSGKQETPIGPNNNVVSGNNEDDINSNPIQIILTEEPGKMADLPYNGSTFPYTLERRDTLKPAGLVNTPKKLAAALEKSRKAAN